MIPDHETNTVYVSDLLEEQHPRIVKALKKLLGDRLKTIHGTKDIWCRDYMPIQLAQDRFVQFKYAPDYLKGYPHLRTDDAARLLELTHNCRRSGIVIDGGNLVRWNDLAILTEKEFSENPNYEPDRLVWQLLRKELEARRLIWVPQEPEDKIGHADGMVRFVNEKTLLVNDYAGVDEQFGEQPYDALEGFELIPFPYSPTHEPGSDPEMDSALGVHMNFLQVGNLIVCPIFKQPEDDQALRTLEEVFPKARIEPLECRKLAMEGGVLNCITWNIKS